MRIQITVTVPDGGKCKGCRFLEFQEPACVYRCVLFNEWELGENEGEAHTEDEAFNCEQCIRVKGK